MTENIQEEVENKIIDAVTFAAGGRLIAFKPENMKKGADLVIERKGKYKEGGISFKINIFVRPTGDYNIVKDFLPEDLNFSKDFYLLFVFFNEVEQKIDDRIWLVPSLEFKDMAEIIKSPDNKKTFRFQSSLESKGKYSKFLIDIRDLGKILLFSLESGEKVDFKVASFGEEKAINLASLKEFITEARENTYAASGSEVDNPRLLGSRQFDFQKGDYFYRDIFFQGGKKFIGQEIIYQSNIPVWGMNYLGEITGRTETDFLKESLLELSDRCRFGQLCQFEKRELKYKDSGQGDLSDFYGKEQIFYKDKNIYNLTYQGGLI